MQPATCLLHSSCRGAYRPRSFIDYSCHLLWSHTQIFRDSFRVI